MSRTVSLRRRAVRVPAGVAVSGLLLGGLVAAPATAGPEADPPATDRAAAAAQLLEAGLLGVEPPPGTALAADVDGPATGDARLDVAALGTLGQVTLGGEAVPLTGAGGLLTVRGSSWHGVVSAQPSHALAASGAVTARGAFDPTLGGPTDVALTRLLPHLGVASAGVVDDLTLRLGTLASRAEAEPGQDPTTGYLLDGAVLELTSPALAALPGTFEDLTPQLEATLTSVLGPTGPVQGALDAMTPPVVDLTVPLLGRVGRLEMRNPTVTADVRLPLGAVCSRAPWWTPTASCSCTRTPVW